MLNTVGVKKQELVKGGKNASASALCQVTLEVTKISYNTQVVLSCHGGGSGVNAGSSGKKFQLFAKPLWSVLLKFKIAAIREDYSPA